jgi:hypothetical protein
MRTDVDVQPTDLTCHRCEYDLRAQPSDGTCPECGASVAESRRVWAIAPWPAWHERDPRWRRRMVAGAWVLTLLPLMALLRATGWAEDVEVPSLLNIPNATRTLDQTFVAQMNVYESLAFCVGAVLLFSREGGRRPRRLDRTSRWGVLGCYIVLVISAAQILFVTALVVVGLAGLFLSIRGSDQPEWTPLLIDVGSGWLRYGPHPGVAADLTLVAVAAAMMGLACVRVFESLRSRRWGHRSTWGAAALLAPVGLAAAANLVGVAHYAVRHVLRPPGTPRAESDLFSLGLFFRPGTLVYPIGDPPRYLTPEPYQIYVEAAKWGAVLGAAVWLTTAQCVALRRRRARGRVAEQ